MLIKKIYARVLQAHPAIRGIANLHKVLKAEEGARRISQKIGGRTWHRAASTNC